ncbi:MAG: pre-peptidase C-terminal domain-containing protein [Phycisphaerales bacterium]|nr:pre-peptidase C-terminal domain-containing protein [Phycisphaerales bacterium]
MRVRAACAIVLAAAGNAQAGTFTESENNNTLGTANGLGLFDVPGGSLIITGSITDNDVDWFEFTLNNTASLAVFAGFAFGNSPDGVMQIVTSTGDVIAFDDDSGVNLMPSIQIESLSAGTYYLGLSGFGDVGSDSVDTDELADGLGHSENFDYKLAVGFSVIPAPGSLAIMGLGGLVATRRRR